MAIITRAVAKAIYPGRSIGLSVLAPAPSVGVAVPGDWDDLWDSVLTDGDISTFGRSLIDDADAATARTTLGLGTMATAAAADYLALAGGTMTGDITLKNASVLTDYAAGKVVLSGTTPMLALGGTSSSFPALKRSGAALHARLADDSGYTALSVTRLLLEPYFSVSGIWNGAGAGMVAIAGNCGGNFDNADIQFGVRNGAWIREALSLYFASDIGSLAADLALLRSAANILALTNASTGGAAFEMVEMTAPAAPAANGGRLYLEDNGAGKTRLMIVFSSGAAQQIAIQP